MTMTTMVTLKLGPKRTPKQMGNKLPRTTGQKIAQKTTPKIGTKIDTQTTENGPYQKIPKHGRTIQHGPLCPGCARHWLHRVPLTCSMVTALGMGTALGLQNTLDQKWSSKVCFGSFLFLIGCFWVHFLWEIAKLFFCWPQSATSK